MDEKPLNVKFGDLFCWSEQQQEEQWKVREKKECRISESSFHQKVLCKKCSLEECCLKRSYLFKGSDGPNRVYIYIIYIYKYIIMYLTTSICLISLWQLWKKANRYFLPESWNPISQTLWSLLRMHCHVGIIIGRYKNWSNVTVWLYRHPQPH